MHRITCFALAALLAGCGGKKEPDLAAAVPEVSETKEETGPGGGAPPKPPAGEGKEVPVEETTLEALLAGAGKAPLVPHPVKLGRLEFLIDAPRDARVTDDLEPRLLIGTAGLEVSLRRKDWHDVTAVRRWWVEHGPESPTRFQVAGPTLLVELEGERFHFVTGLVAGHLDLGVRLVRKGEVGVGQGTRAECLLLLRCARTLRPREPIPKEPRAALEKLGARFGEEDGHLVSLSLREVPATRSTLQLLTHFPDLTALDLAWVRAEGDDFAVLARLAGLEELDLHSTALGDAGLAHVAGLKELRKLTLSWTHISDAGLIHLEKLTRLRVLDLSRNDLTGPGLRPLLALEELEELSLWASPVGDEGAKVVGKLAGLRALNLDDCGVSDAGVAALAGLTKLERLSLRGNRGVTAAGVMKLKGLEGLKHLDVSETGVTRADLPALREALPGAEVEGP